VARDILQTCPVWIYTQSNITSIAFKKLIKASAEDSEIEAIRRCLVSGN
jgi:hypothetical protein